MASTYLTRTPSSAGNRKTWTWSAWIKRTGLGGTQTLMTQIDAWNGNSNAGFYIASNYLTSYNFTTSLNSGGNSYNRPSRYLRDVNSWYHIVVRLDTTQATASDRLRWYVNGEQLTDFEYANYPSQNQDCNFNTAAAHGIAAHTAGSNYFDGSMTHVHFTDGYSYDPSAFGEIDTTTGEWKAKTSPSVNYGTNGFLILKDGNTITDQSSNSNNFTLGGGTLTNLKDNPENIFATLNPLAGTAIGSYTNGNNRVVGVSTSWTTAPSTLAVSSGKFYCEAKAQHTSLMVGILDIDQMITNNFQGTKSNGWGYEGTGTLWNNGNPTTSWGSTYTTGDIIGIAMDLDNNKLYFSKNGTWQNSANPSAGTGGISITADKTYYFAMSPVDSTSSVIEANFGNGYFGTTAVSSAGTNASDNGIFEYDVPTGYTALSTKGLNE
jgi:hypothetical protein